MGDEIKAQGEPVAWMWQYIGRDPTADQIYPCARAFHEMDPSNPPYPKSWKPVAPLYTSAPTIPVTFQEFNEWMNKELPSGTIIGDAGWWASRIYKRFIAAAPKGETA